MEGNRGKEIEKQAWPQKTGVPTASQPSKNGMSMPKMNRVDKSIEAVLQALSDGSEGDGRDRLTHRILMAIARRRERMEWLVSSRSTGKARPRVKRLLFWALAEILYMDGIPGPAVVDAAVGFSKRRHSASEAAYVNAFLRNLLRDMEAHGPEAIFEKAPNHVKYDLPEPLWGKWLSSFGRARCEELARILLCEAGVVIRRKSWPPANDFQIPEGLLPMPAPEWAPWAEL